MRLPRRFSLSFVVLALLALPASGATLTVLSPASVTPGLKAMAEQYSAKAGKAVTVGGGSRAAVLGALRKGPADMVVLPTSDMIEMNLVHGMTPLGRIPVGVAVKAGAPVPDVSTPEKFLAVLRQARGVAFADPSAGTSAGKAIAGLLGLSDFHGVKRVPVQGLAVTAPTSPCSSPPNWSTTRAWPSPAPCRNAMARRWIFPPGSRRSAWMPSAPAISSASSPIPRTGNCGSHTA